MGCPRSYFFYSILGVKNADFGGVNSMHKLMNLLSGRGRNSAFFNQIVLYLETPNLVEYGPYGAKLTPSRKGAPGIAFVDAKLIPLATRPQHACNLR